MTDDLADRLLASLKVRHPDPGEPVTRYEPADPGWDDPLGLAAFLRARAPRESERGTPTLAAAMMAAADLISAHDTALATARNMSRLGMPRGTDDPSLLALGAAPLPDLPPGVNRCTAADGTPFLVALGRDVPEGWEWSASGERWWPSSSLNLPGLLYVVRPPQSQPRTERVPWWEAPGRRLPHGELIGPIAQAYPNDGPAGMYVEYHLPERGTTGNPVRDSEGRVEVLVEGTDG